MNAPGLLPVLSIAVVGVLHTAVPDHWVPITLLARQRGWTKAETAKAAVQARIGHVVTAMITSDCGMRLTPTTSLPSTT